MDFREATDQVAGCITHMQIAEAMSVSIQSIRQARMAVDATSFRNPPPGWEMALVDLARARARQLLAYADTLEKQTR